MTYQNTRLFDAFRRILGRGFSQAEVDAINASMKPDAPSLPEQDFSPLRLSKVGEDLIKRFEGCARVRPDGKVAAYPDPGTGGEPWTIGWGSTGKDGFSGGRIGPQTVWTQAQCDQRASEDYRRYADDVVKALGASVASTSQPQFDAMVSFHYNTGAIARSTLLQKHKAGDYAGAVREFARWNKAGGRVMKGLVRRRAAEEALYRSGMGKA